MSQPNLILERQQDILSIQLNRAEMRNAVDGPTAAALSAAFREFADDDSLKVAILSSRDGGFCAGADLKAIAEEPERANTLSDTGDGPMGPTRMSLNKPVIAAISGHCVAGGLELACWCDLRVADESAVFGVFCRRFGVPLIDGGTIRLPRLIGMSRAMDMILTGRAVSAEEAYSMGLVNRLVPKGGAFQAALELAQAIAKHPQTCLRNDRQSAYEQWSLTELQALQNEFEHGKRSLASGESLAGAKRFRAGDGRHGELTERSPPNA